MKRIHYQQFDLYQLSDSFRRI